MGFLITFSKFLFGSIMLLLFVSLTFISTPELLNPIQTGQFIFFNYFILILTAISLVLWLITNTSIIIITPVDILLTLILVYITVNRYWLQPLHGFSLGYFELFSLALLYIILRSVDAQCYMYLLLAIIVSGISQAVYGLLQWFGFYTSNSFYFDLTGSFTNPGPYAGFLASVFPILCGFFIYKKELKSVIMKSERSQLFYKKWIKDIDATKIAKGMFISFSAIGILAFIIVLPISESRAGWAAVIISSIFLYTSQLVASFNSIVKNTLARLGILVVAVMIIVCVAARFYFFKKDSADGRVLIWRVTADMIIDSPWIGKGYDQFKSNYMNYQADYFAHNTKSKYATLADNTIYAFNEPLQFISENGIFAGFIAIAILFYSFKARHSSYGLIFKVAKAGLISILVFSLFSYPIQILPIKANMVLFLAILNYSQQPAFTITNRMEIRVLKYFKHIAVPLLIATCVVLFGKTHNLYHNLKVWTRAYELSEIQNLKESIEEYEKVLGTFSNDGNFMLNYGDALSKNGQHEKAIEVWSQAVNHLNTTTLQLKIGSSYQSLKQYNKAEKCYLLASSMTPFKFYPTYLLAKLYVECNQNQKAKDAANSLLTKTVKVESSEINLMKIKMRELLKH